MRAEARAKVNIGLVVGARDAGGLHPIGSLFLSIDWTDLVSVEMSDEDAFVVTGSEEVPGDESNLAVRALGEVRRAAGIPLLVELAVHKQIPVAAGLGGGSADAAAVLGLAGELAGLAPPTLAELAPRLGSDVPFCFTGGAAWVSGHGERITAVPVPGDFALAVVVPPFELSTAEVFRRWDELDGPRGSEVDGAALPPSLRSGGGPVRNDLEPAAVALRPQLGDWMADLGRLWGRPVLMSGSGPSLLSWFPTDDEAAGAVAEVSAARAVRACRAVGRGWLTLRD